MGVTLRLGLDAFLIACRRVEPALGRERPIQGALRLRAFNGAVAVEAHSGELYYRATVDGAEVSEGFDSWLIPGRLLIRFLRALEDTGASVVDLVCDDGHDLVVSAEHAEMNLRLVESDAWPWFEPSLDGAVALTSEDLGRMRSVLFAVSSDVQKGALVGVRIRGSMVTGLDNTRLAQVTIDAALPDCLIPAEFLKESLRESVGQVRWSAESGRVVLVDDSGFWSTALLEHAFPDQAVTDLLTRSVRSSLSADTYAVRAALDRVAVLDSARVQMSLTGGMATFRVESPEIGNIEATLPAEGSFEGPVWLDRRHLIEAIQHHDLGTVRFDFTGDDKPVLVPGSRIRQMLVASSRSF